MMIFNISSHFSGFILFNNALKDTWNFLTFLLFIYFKNSANETKIYFSTRQVWYFFSRLLHPLLENRFIILRYGRYLIFQKYFDQFLSLFPLWSPLKPQRKLSKISTQKTYIIKSSVCVWA